MQRTFVFALLFVVACNGRGGDATPTDSGPHDASPGRDLGSGGDAGPHDAGTPTDGHVTDAPAPVDGSAADAGDAGSACADPIPALSASDLPRCSATTFNCMNACARMDGGATATCVQGCAHADTTPPVLTGGGGSLDCIGCLSYQQRYCSDHTGCHDANVALDCCIATMCPGGSCAMTSCSSQYMAWMTCTTTTAAGCFSGGATGGDFAACFPATDGGAP